MTAVELWVVAEVLPLRLRLVPADSTGHLETLTLRAIKAGVDEIDALADIFGISPRLMLDMVGDLWREDRVAIDVGAERESIIPTSKALKELERLDERGSLPSGYKVSDAQQVLLEKLTGRILPLRSGRPFPDDRSLVVPTSSDNPSRANVDHNALVSAAMAGMEDRRQSRRADELNGMRVADVMLPPEGGSAIAARRYVRMTVQVSLTSRDELVVSIDDDALSLSDRQLATRRLAALLSSDPPPPLANRLRSLAARTPSQPRDVSRVLAELRRAADALSACPPANRQRQHDRLAAHAREVHQHADSLAWQEMDVRLIQTEAEHREAVISLIDDTRHQLVLGVPWVTERGLRPFLDALTRATRSGVKVFLLWGIREVGETLHESVRSQLLTIQREAASAGCGGELHVPDVPSYVHAKVVVSDDRRAVVTSRNFFSGGNLKELGVVLTATAGQPAPLLEDILQWTHRVIPSAAIADQLARHRSAFDTPEYRSALPPLVLPELTLPLVRAARNSPLARTWCEAWRAVVTDLERLLRRERPVVSLVTDGYHRTLMYHALEEATRRVVISSDGFSTNAVTTGVVAAAREAAARGVLVTFVYGRGRDEGAAARVSELKCPEPDTTVPVVRQLTDQHVKVLLRDDSVLVGSFNYLSLDSSRRRGRTTGELSVLIESPAMSDAVAALLERARGEAAPVVAGAEVASPTVAVARAAQRVLESLADSPDGADPEAVAAALFHSGAPAQVIQLLRSRAGDLDVERALAALVYAWPETDDAWRGWLRDLVGAGWRRGAWWAVGQLRAALPTDDDVPPPQLTAAAAAEPDELAGLLLSSISDETASPQERDVLCLLGVVQLLRSGNLCLQDPLRRLADVCSDVVQEPVRTVLEGVARYGALPRTELVEIVRNSEASARLSVRWNALEHAVHEMRRYKPNTPPGEQLLASLFGDGEASADPAQAGEMTELELIAAERDPDRLRRWSLRYREQSDAKWVDHASTRAGLARPIDRGQRGSFIHKHAAIRQTAEDVGTAAQDVRSVDAIDPGQLDMMRTMEAQLARARDETVPGWTADLVRRLIDQLLVEIRGDRSPAVLGATHEEWRFPRAARAGHTAETPISRPAVRLLAADICSAWSPSGAVHWLVKGGEYSLADTVQGALLEARLISTAEAEALAAEIERDRAECLAAAQDEWYLLRARADCAGVRMPLAWEEWRGRRSLGRREEAETALRQAKEVIDASVESAGEQVVKAFSARRDAVSPELAERIERLISVGELVAAARALDEDEEHGVGAVPVIDRGRAWPYRYVTLQAVVHQFTHEEHRYPLVRAFVPPPEDADGVRLVATLRSLVNPNEEAVRRYVDAVQLLIADPGIPRRVRPAVHGSPETADVTAALDPAAVPATERSYSADMVLPHHPTLPSLHWTGRNVVAAVGPRPVPGSLFRLSLGMSSTPSEEPVVDVSSVLSLLAPDGDRVASRQLRGIRLLREICSDLPLQAVVDAWSIGPLDSADARIRLWTLLHVMGFEVDEVARASLLAVAGDHPHLLWHLIDSALRELRKPDIDSARLSARWDTATLIARDDFDELVRKAIIDDLPGLDERAVLAAVALMGPDVPATADDIVGFVASGASSRVDQERLAALVDQAAVEQHLRTLQSKRYVAVAGDGRVCMAESVVGRSILRFDPAQWLEETASELLNQVRDPEEALVRELSHSLVQSYRLAGDDPQSLGPRDMLDPDVPCWATRWAGIVISRSGIQELYREESISVTHDLEPDLWISGPSVSFALVLDNLIHNARTAVGLRNADNPGRILISLQAEPEGDTVRLEVSDNGPGMPESVVAAIVSGQFSQWGGRGHGLPVVIRWVTDRGWRLDVDRHPYLGGARVVVRIPRVPSTSGQPA